MMTWDMKFRDDRGMTMTELAISLAIMAALSLVWPVTIAGRVRPLEVTCIWVDSGNAEVSFADQGTPVRRFHGPGGGWSCHGGGRRLEFAGGPGSGRKTIGAFGQHRAGAGDIDPSSGDPAGQSAIHL